MHLKHVLDNLNDPIIHIGAKSALTSAHLLQVVQLTTTELQSAYNTIDPSLSDAEIANRFRDIRAQIQVYQNLALLISQLITETANRT